jgi:hypothetical protein
VIKENYYARHFSDSYSLDKYAREYVVEMKVF